MVWVWTLLSRARFDPSYYSQSYFHSPRLPHALLFVIAISAVCIGVHLLSLTLISLLYKSQGFSVPHQIIVGRYLPVFIPKSSKSLTLSSLVLSRSSCLFFVQLSCSLPDAHPVLLSLLAGDCARFSESLIQSADPVHKTALNNSLTKDWVVHSSEYLLLCSAEERRLRRVCTNRSKYKTVIFFRGNISLIAHPCSFDTFCYALSISSISLTWLIASKLGVQ